MGCLNSHGQFSHWFANIHFSGPCNRKCYFCIGQHMPGLEAIDNLDTWPLPGMDEFIFKCKAQGVKEINLTGSDTDPLLYRHLPRLCAFLREEIPGVIIGLRTNGALAVARPDLWALFDKGSVSITTFDEVLYRKTMGSGHPPDLKAILALPGSLSKCLKVNIVLCPEILSGGADADLFRTLNHLAHLGITKVNLREPYGQPHIGDPLKAFGFSPDGERLGMPFYKLGLGLMDVMYWDVHYVEVESVNLYANGNVSETYPVTAGHDPILGKVEDQGHFIAPGRQFEQWRNKRKLTVVV